MFTRRRRAGAGFSAGAILLPILATIVIYIIVGSSVTMRGVVIYDEFPYGNFVIDKDQTFKFIVKNNAPYEFPFVKLPHTAALEISNATGEVTCEVLTNKGWAPCNETYIDLGYVPPGGSGDVYFKLIANKNNFTITFKSFVNMFGWPVQTNSKSVRIVFINTTMFGDEYSIE